MNIYYVYFYLRSDFTPYYVGKGKNKRAWRKSKGEVYPPKDKSKIILVEENLTELQAFILERYYIRWFGRKDLGTGILRNKSEGGCGGPCGPEGRDKISKKKKKWWTDERRAEQSKKIKNCEKPLYEYGRSEESNLMRSISASLSWTQERREQKSKQMKGKPRPDISKRVTGENNPMFGKQHSEKTKKLQKEKALQIEKTKCEVCFGEFSLAMYKRWHGNNCKRRQKT